MQFFLSALEVPVHVAVQRWLKVLKNTVVHLCTVVAISRTIGANRIIPAVGIPYPLGDPTEGEEESYKIREKLVRRAFKALQTPITEQTVFEKDEW